MPVKKAATKEKLPAAKLPAAKLPEAKLPEAKTSQAATINAKYATDLQAAKATMEEHHVFPDMAKAKPLQISQAPYQEASFQSAMQTTRVYRCAGISAWVRMATSTSIPIRAKKVADVKKVYFGKVVEIFPAVLTIGLIESDLQANGFKIPRGMFGYLEMITPDEMLHAMIFQIVEDIEAHATDDVLEKWRSCVLNTPMEFRVFKSRGDLEWARIQYRENIGRQFELFFSTCLKRLFEVTSMADQMADRQKHQPTVNEVVVAWETNIQQNPPCRRQSPRPMLTQC